MLRRHWLLCCSLALTSQDVCGGRAISVKRTAELRDFVAEKVFVVLDEYRDRGDDGLEGLEVALCLDRAPSVRHLDEWLVPLSPICKLLASWRARGLKVQDVEDAQECKAFLSRGSELAGVLADEGVELHPLHEALSAVMGSSGCCLGVVTKGLSGELEKILDFERPLELREDPSGLWQCLEWSFWGGNGQGSPYEGGLRAFLWQVSLIQEEYHSYSVFEMLTVQFAYLPLCIHRTKAYAQKAALDSEHFGQSYMNCAPTHLSYAIDHFFVAGASDRAQETWVLMRSHRWQPVDWQSIHNTAIGYLPGIAHWPWWQAHPAVKPYIDFLERHFNLIAKERRALDWHANLQEDAFPATSNDKSWHKIEFWRASLL